MSTTDTASHEPTATGPVQSGRSRLLLRLGLFLALAVATVYFCLGGRTTRTADELGIDMNLPATALGWPGYDLPVSKAERDILPDDTTFSKRAYVSPERIPITLSVVLSGEDRNSIHRPEICLPGQGFTVVGAEVRTIPLAGDETLDVMDLKLERLEVADDGSTRPVQARYLYWFVGGDITTPYHHRRIAYTALDNIIGGINHRWAYVSVMATVVGSAEQGWGAEGTPAKMEELIAEVAPRIQRTFVRERSWSRWVPGL